MQRALEGRVAVVTGASRAQGIGAAVVRRLVDDGARVLVHSFPAHDAEQPWGADAGGGQALVDDLAAAGGEVEHVDADLADPLAPAAVIRAARERFGHVDVLVANHARSSSQSLADLTADELDLSFAVNARATLLLVQAFAAQHDAREGGRVVLFTSGQYHAPMPDTLSHAVSKGAVHQVTASLSAELAPHAVTVNCVDSGPTDTGWPDESVRVAMAGRFPRGRWGAPSDAARLVAWLVSDEAMWVTGQVLRSDGGWAQTR